MQDLWIAFRPCYIRAFKDAADYAPNYGETIKGTKNAKQDDFVSKDEFRHFCIYAVIYAAMFDAFAKVDGGGAGRDAGDDKRIELNEFLKGFGGIGGHGFLAFKDIENKKQATQIFERMDDNGGGIILLDEWCNFIKDAEVKANTEVGKLLIAKAEFDPEKAAAMKAAADAPKPTAPYAEPNEFGMRISKGKMGASKDFFDFSACFAPYCAETKEAEKLREEGMIEADPNGNGLCSLAEIETFVLKRLLATYPNTGKGNEFKTPGKVAHNCQR